MSASFRRRNRNDTATASSPSSSPLSSSSSKTIAGLKGTKPWAGGITLTSVGLRDLDMILGGGQPVGTCILLEEDRWTRDLALCLIKYWCAEAISHEQALLIPFFQDEKSSLPRMSPLLTVDYHSILQKQGCTMSMITDLVDSLPGNLHWDKAAGKIADVEGQDLIPLEILEEGEEEDDAEDGLQIAWQYRKSVQQERLGHKPLAVKPSVSSNEFCHSFDLNGRLASQEMNHDCISVFDGTCCGADHRCEKRICAFQLFQKLKAHVIDRPTGKLIRLLLFQVPIETASIAVPLLLAYIRSEELPVVLLVSVHSWKCPSESALLNLRRASDVVMQTEGFASRIHYPPPPEFRHLQGLLILPKVSSVTAAAAVGGGHFADMTMSKRPAAHVYGLKRDRRKLHISLLHIPPEDYAGESGSVGSGARAGGGRTKETTGCGGGSGGSTVLDF